MKVKPIFYIVVLLLILSSVEAGSNLKITGARCHEQGIFTVTATTRNVESTDLTNTTVKIFNKETGWKTAEGSWNKDEIKRTSTMDKTAVYTSKFGMLTIPGKYTVHVYYENCTYPPCEDQYTMTECPGFSYSCELAELEIRKAFQRGDELWVHFSGININQYEKLDIRESIRISIDSNSRTMNNKPFAGNMMLKYEEEDAYRIIIPLKEGETIYNVGLSIAECKEKGKSGNPSTISYEIKKPVDFTTEMIDKEEEEDQEEEAEDNITEVIEDNNAEDAEESTETIVKPVRTRMKHTGMPVWTIVLIIIAWTVAFIVIGILLFLQFRKR